MAELNYPVLGKYIHKYFAAELNMLVWSLIDLAEKRKPEDEYRMINAAYASLYHWSEIGAPENLQRGEWLIAHVWALLKKPEFALYHAKACLHLTELHEMKDFDLAFGYEVMARAYGVAGDADKYAEYYAKAREAGEKIEDAEDRKIFEETIETCLLCE